MSIEPLLNVPWQKVGTDTRAPVEGMVRLVGQWYEDNSEYSLFVPEQLADCIIKMQNYFAEKYKIRCELYDELRKTQHVLFERKTR